MARRSHNSLGSPYQHIVNGNDLPPACQEIVPVIPFVNGTATVQSDPQPPVFGGDAGMYVSNEGSDTVSVVLGGLTVGNV